MPAFSYYRRSEVNWREALAKKKAKQAASWAALVERSKR